MKSSQQVGIDQANRTLEPFGIELRPGGQDSPPNWFDAHSRATGELVKVFPTIESALGHYASESRTGGENK